MLRRALTAAAVAVGLAAGLAACSGSGSTSASSTASSAGSSASSPATTSGSVAPGVLCDAAGNLRDSLAALQQVDVGSQGVGALAAAFDQVKTDVATLAGAAKAQYTAQVGKVKADVAALQAAIDVARTAPSAQTIGAAAAATRLLVSDGQALVSSVGSSC